jgi:exodeoxyribonuclease-5
MMFTSPYGMVCPNGHGGTEEAAPAFTLTNDQQLAWDKLQGFLKTSHPIFVLKGFAGTGKSFLMKKLLELPHNFIFSAPTNKASHVLAGFLGQSVKTTYSVLGLRMTAEDDKMVLSQSETLPDLGTSPILVIDEAGMIPSFMAKLLRRACADYGWRVIFVGDPAQLNPVGEDRSPVWSLAHEEHRVLLKEVKRFDNQLLKLAGKLRDCVKDPSINLRIANDNDGEEGVFVVPEHEFKRQIKKLTLADWSKTKVVVWRNKTADKYNQFIRKALGFTGDYAVGEPVLLAAPLVSDSVILGYTDEELIIKSIDARMFSLPEGTISAYAMAVEDRSFSLYVPKDPAVLTSVLNKRAELASSLTGTARKKAWQAYWELKQTFQPVRYGYAMTAHRLQGSTCEAVYVDQTDIRANPERRDAYRAMYVAGTRPTKKFITF